MLKLDYLLWPLSYLLKLFRGISKEDISFKKRSNYSKMSSKIQVLRATYFWLKYIGILSQVQCFCARTKYLFSEIADSQKYLSENKCMKNLWIECEIFLLNVMRENK